MKSSFAKFFAIASAGALFACLGSVIGFSHARAQDLGDRGLPAVEVLGNCEPLITLLAYESKIMTCTFATAHEFDPADVVIASVGSGLVEVRSSLVYAGGWGALSHQVAVTFMVENLTRRPVFSFANVGAVLYVAPKKITPAAGTAGVK